MSWITLTEADVKTRLAGAELTAFKSSALASGMTGDELLADILSGVIREVRGKVAACAKNTLGEGNTIPDECLHHALAMVVYRLITRLPLAGNSPLVEERRKAYDDALLFLKEVAACEVGIVQPDTATDEEIAAPVPSVGSRTRKFTRDTQDGI